MSTTPRSVDGLWPFYALNVGPDAMTVYPRGPMRVTGEVIPGQSLQPFSVEIPFETPFLYDRSWGDLLLDIITYTGTSVGAGFDAAELPGDSVSSLMGSDFQQGVDFTIGMVAQFDYRQVPEAATSFLIGVGALLLIVGRRRRIPAA